METRSIRTNLVRGAQLRSLQRVALWFALPLALAAGGVKAQAFTQTQALSGTGSYALAESSVAIYGDTMVVGRQGWSGNLFMSFPALVKIYLKGSDSWVLYETLASPDGEIGDLFGYSVAVDADTIIIGAPQSSPPDPVTGAPELYAGRAYIYHIGQTCTLNHCVPTYSLVARPQPSSVHTNAAFGNSVAVSGNVAVVGAPSTSNSPGAAYVYNRNANGKPNLWGLTTTLIPSFSVGEFGYAVATDGAHILVGAPLAMSSGLAELFTVQSDGRASYSDQFTTKTPSAGRQFGSSVAITPAYIAVGAPVSETNILPSVDLFENGGSGTYTFVRQMTSPGGYVDVTARFGQAVAFDGTLLAVGASGENYSELNSVGAVYVYQRSNSGSHAWCLSQVVEPNAATLQNYNAGIGQTFMGQTVAFDGLTLAAGAPSATVTGAGLDAGAVFIFSADEIFYDGFEFAGAAQCF